MKLSRLATVFLLVAASLGLTACVSGEDAGDQSSATTELRIDWAYYNPESLVIKEKGWLADALKKADKNVKITWIQSLGSNKANANLRAGAIDFGSTAGTPALLARANGTPLKTIDVYSRPEWSAIVVPKGSSIASVKQLKGKKVAATKGTDPYFFLLQALKQAGLAIKDITFVNLQHQDGKTALERHQVDAWAGLDPYMAQTEIQAGSTLIYRNLAFNSYGFLNVSEAFLKAHSDLVQVVVDTYERARAWIVANPTDAEGVLARAAKIPQAVAARQLTERTHLDISGVPGAAQHQVLANIAPLLASENLVQSSSAVQTALNSLFEPEYAQNADPKRAT